MGEQLTGGAIDQTTTEKIAIPNTPSTTNAHSTTYIPAGNNDVVNDTDLGGTDYDRSLHSTVEPIYEKDALNQTTVVALKIHNPDNTQIQINMYAYKSLGAGATRDLRNALLTTYEREAATDYGTSLLTQNAQYFKEVSWAPKTYETLNDPTMLEASMLEGQLSGSLLRKSIEEQSNIFYQQHEAMQEAVNRALVNTAHIEFTADTKPPITLQDLLNKHISADQRDKVLTLMLESQEASTQKTEINHSDLSK